MDDPAPMTDKEDAVSGSAGRITVFLLYDHEVVRRGIAEILGAQPDIVVVGEAGTAAEAVARIPAARPAVAILDAQCPMAAESTSVATSAPPILRFAA